MSYATFTIIDIAHDGEVQILEYDNPQCFIMRGSEPFDPQWQCIILQSEKNAGKELRSCIFRPEKEDRIVVWSDGVAQSGMGSEDYPFGWGVENANAFAHRMVKAEPDISATKLSSKVVNMAYVNDGYHSKDDTSCAVIYFREPRKLLICTGPPYDLENDKKLAKKYKEFNGKKIICGATTSDILARELNQTIEDSFEFIDPELPPVSHMEGADLITEGILTLGKTNEILDGYNDTTQLGKGPADSITKLLLESDKIQFIVGTRINEAHQDPSLPVELEIRRTVIKRMAMILEEKFLKEVSISFL
jgi:sulfur transfer complex TusBCD TusB component (DsrH family)